MAELLHLFCHAHGEVKETMRAHCKKKVIHDAFGSPIEMTADEKSRYLAEIREKSLKNKNSELGAARREGMREGPSGSWMRKLSMKYSMWEGPESLSLKKAWEHNEFLFLLSVCPNTLLFPRPNPLQIKNRGNIACRSQPYISTEKIFVKSPRRAPTTISKSEINH